MTSQIASFAVKHGTNWALNKTLGKDAKRNKRSSVAGKDDPLFANVVRNGRVKKRVKQVPDFIPPHDAKILQDVKKWSYRMDCGLVNVGSVHIGWGSLIGWIPEIGDAIDLLFAYMILKKMTKVEGGLPPKKYAKMRRRIVIDGVIGLIPFIGDIADTWYRCNTRNVKTFESYLFQKYGPKGVSKEELNRGRLGSIPEDESGSDDKRQWTGTTQGSHPPRNATRSRTETREANQGWRSWLGRRDPPSDVEHGRATA